MSETIYEKAMRLLGRNITKAVDPDDADARVDEGAEPTDKKLEEAGEEASAGGQAGGEGGVPGDPGAGEGGEGAPEPGAEGEGEGEGEGDEFDEHGNDDMSDDDVRELKKAFGLTDFDNVMDTKNSTNITGMLGSILAYMKKQDAFSQKLTSELAELKALHASGKADQELRVTMKGLDEKVDGLQKVLDGLHRTAPAAAAPKAFSKAMETSQPVQQSLTLADVTALVMQRKISAAEATRLTRQINHGTPANAGN